LKSPVFQAAPRPFDFRSLEKHLVIRSLSFPAAARLVALAAALALGGCSTIDNMLSGDKIDYRSSGTGIKPAGLEVPPDLTQLTRDSRYQQTQGASVSAAAYQSGTPVAAAAASAPAAIAPDAIGDLRIERLGNERWLRTSLTPEQLWPQLQAFWKDGGFTLTQDQASAGVMETDWAENRGKLPQDFIRSSIGKVFDSAYSTGELDRFRTRVERGANGGTEVYITHRGMIEVYVGDRKESTTWQPRAADPQLEASMLSRLMIKLGATDPVATAQLVAATAATGGPARARLLADQPSATLQVDDGFDRAWRRVGVALDRSGFTVEDRDRTQGVYYVRYIDPKFAGKEEPNLFSKMFDWFGKKSADGSPMRYRVAVKGQGDRSTVTVLTNEGGPENGDAGKRITSLLLDDLK
jgi:outer membrane protein assembly factor BamC